MVMCLAHAKPEEVPSIFIDDLFPLRPANPIDLRNKLDEYLFAYVYKQWMGKVTIAEDTGEISLEPSGTKIRSWSVFHLANHRTNNNCEAFHYRLHNALAKKQAFWQFYTVLRQEQLHYETVLHDLTHGGVALNPPNKWSLAKEARMKSFHDRYVAGTTNGLEFVTAMSMAAVCVLF